MTPHQFAQSLAWQHPTKRYAYIAKHEQPAVAQWGGERWCTYAVLPKDGRWVKVGFEPRVNEKDLYEQKEWIEVKEE